MKRFFCFCWSAVFGLCFLSAASNVILRNGTTSVITSIFVIEGEKPPVQQSVNLLPASKFERTLRKMQRKAEFYGEEFDEKSIACEKNWQLKNGVKYRILFKSENGDLFLRDDIYIERKTENLVIEFKKQNRIERDWLVRYDKTVQENILKQKQMQDLRRPLCFMAGFGIILLLILTGFIAVDTFRHKKFGEPTFFEKLLGKNLSSVQKSKRWMEIAGVFIMLVPVIISFLTFKSEISKTYFWFFTHKIEKDVSVQATMLTAIAAVFIYGSYLLRYNFFKKDSAEQVFFSVVQAILNIWAISGLCSMFVGNEVWNVPVLNINSQTCLLLIILLSWIGARSISGFLWIILVIIGISHITEISEAMGIYGALYIVMFFISLLLQLTDTVHLEDFKNDFCSIAAKTGQKIGSDIDAGKDTVKKLSGKVISEVLL